MSRRSRGHDYLGWALVALALLAPLPFGGIRAFFPMVYAVIVAAMGLFYATGLYHGHVRPRMPLSSLTLPVILFAVAMIWLAITILPLPGLGAPEWANLAVLGGATGRISIGPGPTFDMLVRYLTYAMFFILTLQVAVERQRARTLFRVIYWGIAAHAMFALAALVLFGDVLLFMPKDAYVGDATGAFVNRNSFATFTAFGAIMGMALLLGDEIEEGRSRLGRNILRLGLYGVPLLVIALALIYSHSRMGMFVAALGVSVIAFLALFKTSGLKRIFSAGLIGAGLIGVIVLGNTGGILFDRLATLDRDADTRLDMYEQTLDLIAKRPLVGYGGGTYEDAFKAVKHDPISTDFTIDAAHNLYLELMAELGIPVALAVVISVLLLAGTAAVAALRRRENWAMPAASAAAALAGGVHSLVDFSLQIPAIVLMLLLILGIGFSQSKAVQSSTPS